MHLQLISAGLKAILLSVFISFFSVIFVSPAAITFASSQSEACESIGGTYNTGTCSTDGTSVNSVIITIVNTLSIFVGVLAVIMLLFGGFRYVTSGGDSNNVGNAKKTIIYAIVGMVIAFSAQMIVQFVLEKATDTSTTTQTPKTTPTPTLPNMQGQVKKN